MKVDHLNPETADGVDSVKAALLAFLLFGVLLPIAGLVFAFTRPDKIR